MILVTGGTGLIGSHLLYHLTSKGQSVRAIYRSEKRIQKTKQVFAYYGTEINVLFNKIEWQQGDITDINDLEALFEGITKVYHCAALISFDPNEYKKLHHVNVEGTANIINLSLLKGVSKICYVSSIAALGSSDEQQTIDEESEWSAKGASVYGLTKRNAELEVWRGTQEGLDAVIVNPGIVLGPGFWKSGSGIFFYHASKERQTTVPGGGSFVTVKDVVESMVGLMESSVTNERFILVNENESYLNILKRIANALGVKAPSKTYSSFVLGIFWRLDWLRANLFAKRRMLSKNMAQSLPHQKHHNADKIQHTLGLEFGSLEPTIKFCSQRFKEDFPQLF